MINFLSYLRFYFLLSLVFIGKPIVHGQNIDSLKREWQMVGNDHHKKLKISTELSDAYFNVHLDSLEKYSKIQIELAKKVQNEKEICVGFSNLGSIYFRKGNIEKALFYYQKAYKIAEDLKYLEAKLSISVNIASLNIIQGKNVQALKHYFVAKNNLFKLKNTGVIEYDKALKYEGQLNNNIGIVYFNIGDFKNATRFYSEAMTISLKAKDSSTLAKVYTNLGEIELKEKNFNVAEEFLYRGKRLKEILDDSISLKINFLLLGVLYLEMDRLVDAKKNFTIAENLLEKYPDYTLIKSLYTHLGVYFMKINQVNKSLEYLNKAKEVNSIEYSLKDVVEISKLLSEAYFLKRDFKTSNFYLLMYENARDSLFSSKNGAELAKLEILFNNENKKLKDSLELAKSDNKLLENQKELFEKNEEIRLKEVQNFYLIIWLVFVVIAFGTIVYVLNIVRKRNKELRRSVKEKEALMKEVHHRVKNNFQIISSLVNIQANKIHSKALIGPMINMQNRIIAMSLVHEKLYVSDFQESVDVNEYLKDLVDSIGRSLLTKRSKITITNSGEAFQLNLETAIPLGLIVNELITNSIKYGSKQDEEVLIDFHVEKTRNEIKLIIKDFGKGFPEGFDSEEITDSIGLELVHVLIEQLDGEVIFSNDKGAKVEIKFKV